MGKIERVTMFKVPRPEDRLRALEQYKVMKRTAVKDGKPYILTAEAGLPADEPRAQGWNVAVKTTFASKADMDYYDKECAAHQELKRVMGEIRTDVLTVWFESVLGGIEAGAGVAVVGEEGKGDAKVDQTTGAEGKLREEEKQKQQQQQQQQASKKELNGGDERGKGKEGANESKKGGSDSKTQNPTKPAKKGFFTKWREDTASAYSKLGPGGHQKF